MYSDRQNNQCTSRMSNVKPLFFSITLHLKISCPPSPAHSQTSLPTKDPHLLLPPRQPAPQINIQLESDSEDSCSYATPFYLSPSRGQGTVGMSRDFHHNRHPHFTSDACAETILQLLSNLKTMKILTFVSGNHGSQVKVSTYNLTGCGRRIVAVTQKMYQRTSITV